MAGRKQPHLGPAPVRAEPEAMAAAAMAILVAVAGVFLGGAHLAARLAGSSRFSAGLADSAVALARWPSTLSDPAGAWGQGAAAHLPGPVGYYACLGLVSAVAVAAAVGGRRVWTGPAGARRPLGVEPDAGLASARDLRALVVPAPQPGRLTLGRVGGRLVAAEPQASLAVVGPSGCGKSAGFAVPALLEWDGPVIATSVKSDLVDATIGRRCELGKVWVYDPFGCTTHERARWSPLDACRTWEGAIRVAAWLCEAAEARRDSVTDPDYWHMQALKALAPHLYAGALGGHSIRQVVRWIDTQSQEPVRSVLLTASGVDAEVVRSLHGEATADERRQLRPRVRAEVLESVRQLLRADPGPKSKLAEQKVTTWPLDMQEQFDERVEIELDRRLETRVRKRILDAARDRGDVDALIAAESLWVKEERLRGSIYATLQNVLLCYADPGVAAAADRCDLDMDRWLEGSNTIYVVATAHEQSRLRPVFTVLIQQAIRRAYETANSNGGTLERPCLLLLDEAGNIVPLDDLPGYAATARSHGISLVTIWQDVGQIRAIYGRRAPTVLNNHRAKIFGTGISDADTLDYVSTVVGDERRTERSYSIDLAGASRRSVSEHTSYRRLLPADVVRRMGPNQAILLYGSELPAHLRLRPWFRDRGLSQLAGPGAESAGAPPSTRDRVSGAGDGAWLPVRNV